MEPRPANLSCVICFPSPNKIWQENNTIPGQRTIFFLETPKEIENAKEGVTKIFKENGLRVMIEANKRVINFWT